jgi:tripartite-type tricarboxylate transporter receptor subunit TctC
MRHISAFAALLLACLTFFSSVAAAAPYPEKPIRLVVPYPPGGTTDVLARIISQGLSEKLGVNVVVENKPGGGNNIGTEFVIK